VSLFTAPRVQPSRVGCVDAALVTQLASPARTWVSWGPARPQGAPPQRLTQRSALAARLLTCGQASCRALAGETRRKAAPRVPPALSHRSPL
jgi:hypothetical protein